LPRQLSYSRHAGLGAMQVSEIKVYFFCDTILAPAAIIHADSTVLLKNLDTA
jgi:hypothetical protein